MMVSKVRTDPMRIGVGRFMQNYLDLDSIERGHASPGVRVSDATIYDEAMHTRMHS